MEKFSNFLIGLEHKMENELYKISMVQNLEQY